MFALTFPESARLVTPPVEEETYPYVRVWRSIILQMGTLGAVMVGLYVVTAFLGIELPTAIQPFVNIGLAILPAGLWLFFSRFAENFALEPRARLLTVFLVSALTANAIGIPFVNEFIQPSDWLALDSVANRLIGFTVTAGIVQELLKYLVVRYVAWPQHYRVRVDSIAYCYASAIGYGTILCIDYVINTNGISYLVMMRIFSIISLNVIGSMIVSYGLSELYFGRANALLMPFTLLVAALVNGLGIAFRSSLMNASVFITGAFTRPSFSLGFSLVLAVAIPVVVAFFYNISERRDIDLQRGVES